MGRDPNSHDEVDAELRKLGVEWTREDDERLERILAEDRPKRELVVGIDPADRKDYGAFIILEQQEDGSLKIVEERNGDQVIREWNEGMKEVKQDPRGMSMLRGAYSAWQFKQRCKDFYREVYGGFDPDEARYPALADEVWVLYEMNGANKNLHGYHASDLFLLLGDISFTYAENHGYLGTRDDWHNLLNEAGRTHWHRHKGKRPGVRNFPE